MVGAPVGAMIGAAGAWAVTFDADGFEASRCAQQGHVAASIASTTAALFSVIASYLQ